MNKETNNTIQAFWISLGSLFAFGFGIVSSMILSRYFPKEDYGTYKQVLYVYNTLLSVFTLGLPKTFSYFLPRTPINQSKNLIKKITNLFFLLGGIFSATLYIFSMQIAVILKNPDLELAIKIFSPVPFFMLPTMGLEGILATYKRTQFMAIYTVLNNVLKLIFVALPVIFFKGGYIQAIIGFTIASFICFVVALYLKYLPVKNAGNEHCPVSYGEIFRFSLPLMYASIWGIIITSADQFFISRYFGTAIFAEFSNGSIELPFVGMVLGATSTVLAPLFSKQIYNSADPRKDIFPVWLSVFGKTAKIIYPLVIYFWFFADIIMMVLYGEKYINSGIYFRIKLISNLFTLITYAPLIIAIGATKFYGNVMMFGILLQFY
jgi:O-antigen/teichoic acid export membrane protein